MVARPVLFVDHAPALGGAERSLLLILEHLDRRRWSPHVAGTPGPLLTRAARLGVETYEVPVPRLRRSARFPLDLMRGASTLTEVMWKTGASAIVGNTVRAAVYSAAAATLSHKPFIWHMRDFWLSESRPSHPRLDDLGKRLLAGAATVVVCNSAAVAEHLPQSPNARIVHNGIDVNVFQPALSGDRFRRAYGILERAPLVGMVGRLRPWKGQLRFLEVAHRVHKREPHCRFVVVGGDPFAVDDDYARSLVLRTKALGLEKVVTFSGHLDDVRPALAAMDLFVHPGEPEPFGLVNIEAMAMGRPVVAFAHGALPEIVNDGISGVLVPPNDIQAMAQRILHLLPDVASRSRMGQAARQRVVDGFSIERVVADFDAMLREVTEKTS